MFGVRDIRQVVRRRDRPPDGPTRRTARLDCRQEPSAPAVDLAGKCNPGKVSRTVSTSPLTLDMTVVCIPEPEIVQPMAVTQGALPPDTVNKTVASFDTSTQAVATPATVVGKPDPQSKDFPTLRLSESSDLLPSFGLSSSSSSSSLPTAAEDSSPSFSPNRVREGLSQNSSGEGSLFNVSPLSPGLVVRPTREGGAAPSEGVLLQTMLGDFNDSVLGDSITYARIEQLPGSESPLSLPVYAWPPNSALLMDSVIQTVLAPRKSECLAVGTSVADPPVTPGNDGVLKSGLPGCPYRFLQMVTRHLANSCIILAF